MAALDVDAIAVEAIDVETNGVVTTCSTSHEVPLVNDECNKSHDVYSYSPSNAPLPHCLYTCPGKRSASCNKEYGVLDDSALSHDQQISLQLEVKNSKEMTSDETEREAKRYKIMQ